MWSATHMFVCSNNASHGPIHSKASGLCCFLVSSPGLTTAAATEAKNKHVQQHHALNTHCSTIASNILSTMWFATHTFVFSNNATHGPTLPSGPDGSSNKNHKDNVQLQQHHKHHVQSDTQACIHPQPRLEHFTVNIPVYMGNFGPRWTPP